MAVMMRWFSRMSPRERAVVLGGGAILVLVLGWLFVVTPLLERNTATADLVPERERLLVRRMDLLARRTQITGELQAANARVEQLNARLLTAAAPAVAASELQKLVKDMAAEARTEIRSERILPPEERSELLEIPVEIAVSAEIRQLVDLLARVEAAQKLLTVKDLRVRVVNVSQPRELLATLTVSGFILPPGKTRT
jgi:type II secretory pathway component PulM